MAKRREFYSQVTRHWDCAKKLSLHAVDVHLCLVNHRQKQQPPQPQQQRQQQACVLVTVSPVFFNTSPFVAVSPCQEIVTSLSGRQCPATGVAATLTACIDARVQTEDWQACWSHSSRIVGHTARESWQPRVLGVLFYQAVDISLVPLVSGSPLCGVCRALRSTRKSEFSRCGVTDVSGHSVLLGPTVDTRSCVSLRRQFDFPTFQFSIAVGIVFWWSMRGFTAQTVHFLPTSPWWMRGFLCSDRGFRAHFHRETVRSLHFLVVLSAVSLWWSVLSRFRVLLILSGVSASHPVVS